MRGGWISELLGAVEEELRRAVSLLPPFLFEMASYHLEGGGKRLRPLLCLLSCEGVGGSWRKALPAAAAVELVHNFSLVHDDIQDRSPKRRGKPAVWTIWGAEQGINCGDALLSLAFLMLSRGARERDLPSHFAARASEKLASAVISLCRGQALDISFEGRADVSEEEYREMAELKTSSLFACALELGALAGGEEREEVLEDLRDFGTLFGLAFQIFNDLEGVWGKEEDLKRKKKTLPVIYGLGSPLGGEIRGILMREGELSQNEIGRLRELLDASGARGYTGKVAEKLLEEAERKLRNLPLSAGAKEKLEEVLRIWRGRD